MTDLYEWLTDPTQTGDDEWLMPDYLSRYTDAAGLADLLNDGSVRMNVWSRMNDPRESRRWRATSARGRGSLTDSAIDEHIDAAVRRSARLLCLSKDRPPQEIWTAQYLLHRSWANVAQWAHYADEHRGACLIFRVEDVIAAERTIPPRDGQYTTWGSVKYKDGPVPLELAGTFASLDELDDEIEVMLAQKDMIKRLFMTKNRSWEYEREIRLAIISS